MTAEEKRERLLKRLLPGLAITVLYFVFISGIMADKMKKAESDYKKLMMSGISKSAVPEVLAQQQQVQQQLTQVQKNVSELQEKLKKMAGFLSNSVNSSNIAMAEVTGILDNHQIKLRKDEKSQLSETQLSPALKEVWQSLKPPKNEDAKKVAVPNKPLDSVISTHHLWLKGSYQNMYQALKAIAEPKLQTLTVSLTMKMPETDDDNSGEMEWELILWM